MEEKTQGYKILFIWQQSMEMVPQIYCLTKRFPKEEMYGLTSQLRRAMVSVPSNIAEGQGRHHRKEFFNFLSIARGSLAEVDTLLNLAHRLGYAGQADLQKFENQIVQIRRMLQKLMQRLVPSPSPVSRHPSPDLPGF